jgi:Ca-activated chloride channel homolog
MNALTALALASVEWATPWGAGLLLIPLVFAWVRHRQHRSLNAWADPHLQPWTVISTGHTHSARFGLEVIAWCLLAVAAAGPRIAIDDPNTAPPAHPLTLMVVVDISASMAAHDITPNRLARAQLELHDLSQRLRGERLGLIVYAGRAGLLLAPTHDTALIQLAIARIGHDLIEAPGTATAEALRLATQHLATEKHRAILLVSDSETEAPPSTSDKDTTPLFVLTTASTQGASIPLTEGGVAMQHGAPVISRPQSAAWQRFSQQRGGRFSLVHDGDADWRTLYDDGIARVPGLPTTPPTARIWQTLHSLPLALALGLLILVRLPMRLPRLPFKRAHAPILALIVIGLVQPHPAAAAPTPPTRERAWAEQMRAGAAAWKQHDYGGAMQAFGWATLVADDGKERSDALYNLGNAHFALGHWQAAQEAWTAVLATRSDARARRNLVEAERQLRTQRSGGPMDSDLRGRGGGLAIGEVDVDYDRNRPIEAFAPTPQGPLNERAGNAHGARLASGVMATQRFIPDPRHLPSGLKKLDGISDRPRAMLRKQLQQDTPPDAQPPALLPW